MSFLWLGGEREFWGGREFILRWGYLFFCRFRGEWDC